MKRTSASRPHRKFLLSAAAIVCSAIALLAGVGAAAAQAAGTPAAASGGTWGTAREVAGALNSGGLAGVLSVSCKSAGNCSAGGDYTTRSGNGEAFVVSQVNGTWRTAQEVAGRLNTGGAAQVLSVSCGSPGNCSAGGLYASNSRTQAFVVSEVRGTWRTAQGVAGRLNVGGSAWLNSVSCASPGNCSAGGLYTSRSGTQAFVVSEVRGTWRAAQEVAGALNAGGGALVNSVSCASPGNCSAGGSSTSRSGALQAFVVSERNGAWGAARKIAIGGNAEIAAVSCPSAGNCSAGGSTSGQAFVVSERSSTWGTAQLVPGTAALNTGRNAEVDAVSCASAGRCSAGGDFTERAGRRVQAFVVSET